MLAVVGDVEEQWVVVRSLHLLGRGAALSHAMLAPEVASAKRRGFQYDSIFFLSKMIERISLIFITLISLLPNLL